MKPVYCIIVTYNGMQWIDRCLKSLLRSSYPVRIIVIDNGSADLTVPFIHDNFPSVHLIRSTSNLGFGQANNVGLKLAIGFGGEFFFLLNQDAFVETETIAALMNEQQNRPELGILSPLHFDGTGKELDKYFQRYLTISAINGSTVNTLIANNSIPKTVDTQFVNAAAWLMSKECVTITGGFDPIFFHYGEDVNYCQRALRKGFQIGIFTGAKIYHDRQDRIKKKPADWNAQLKQDYVQFLNQVCDPGQQKYRQIIFRRTLRYTLHAFRNMLQFRNAGFKYNFGMARQIIFSFFKITRSRKISCTISRMPHL